MKYTVYFQFCRRCMFSGEKTLTTEPNQAELDILLFELYFISLCFNENNE